MEMLIVQCMWYTFIFILPRNLCHTRNVDKSRSTNNEMRFIGDVYMFFMYSVSIGQCVNQTSGYLFIVFIVIWHICIQCTRTLLILQIIHRYVLLQQLQNFNFLFLRFEFVDFFMYIA